MEMQKFSVKNCFNVVLKVLLQAMRCPFRKRGYIDISLSSLNFIFLGGCGGKGDRIGLLSDLFLWNKVTLYSLLHWI